MRIISLLPAATDTIVALGATDLLVGVTHECDTDALPATMPRVTGTPIDRDASPAAVDQHVRELHQTGHSLFNIDTARIAALAPDLIVTQALCDVCAVHEDDVRDLAARLPTRPVVITTGARTLSGVFDDITTIARAIDRLDDGEELLTGLRSRMRSVHDTLKRAKAPRPTVVVIEWTDPLMTAGHWVPEMVHRAGGRDVGAEPGAHSVVRPAQDLRALAAEVVVVAPCGYDLAAAAVAALAPGLSAVWTSDAAVWAVDSNRNFSRPGPKLVNGIETLARLFNPGCFTPASSRLAQRIR